MDELLLAAQAAERGVHPQVMQPLIS